MKNAAGTLDQLLVTISGGTVDFAAFLPLLKPYGNLHFLGVPADPITTAIQPLLFSRLSISASLVGGEADTQCMLEFSAKHGVKPMIEEFTHSTANEAIQKVRDGTIRFRAVLKNDLV